MNEKSSTVPEPPFDSKRVYDVPMDSIFIQPGFNCRGHIDPTSVMELARDIRDRGLDFPIAVQPWKIDAKPDMRFRLVAGFRRHMAHKINNAKTITAFIKTQLTDVDARILNLTENIQRENLNILQEAHAIEHLKDAELGQEEIARRVGKSRGWVQDRVYLLELPDEIQAEAAAGVIGTKEIRNLWSLPSTQQQFEWIKRYKDSKLAQKKKEPSVDKIKRLGRNEKRLRTKTEIEELQDTIREVLGNGIATRVLGWTIAAISDLEVHQFIADLARQQGRFYAIPDGLSGPAKVVVPDADARIIGASDAAAAIGLPWADGAVGDVADDSDLDALAIPDPEDERRGQTPAPVSGES